MYLVFPRCSLCTLYFHGGVYVPCISTVEFMYLVFTRWSLCTLYLHGGVYVPCIYTVEFMYLVFTRWSLCTLHLHACQVRVTVGDSPGSLLLFLCCVFRALINSLVCWSFYYSPKHRPFHCIDCFPSPCELYKHKSMFAMRTPRQDHVRKANIKTRICFYFFFFHKAANIILLTILSLLRKLRRLGSLL